MISMGPIGHSICRNYRKPMKILFCSRLVPASRARYTRIPAPTPPRRVAAVASLRSIRRCSPLAIAGPIVTSPPEFPSPSRAVPYIFFNTLI